MLNPGTPGPAEAANPNGDNWLSLSTREHFVCGGEKLANRTEKGEAIAAMVGKFGRARAMIVADYRGLNVAQMTDLRRKAREAGIEIKVTKNTLASRAAREAGAGGLSEHLKGPAAVAIGYDDLTAPSRLLLDFARTARTLEIKGGFAEGRSLTAQQARDLATMPSREVLLAMVLGGISAPLSNMASVLAAPIRGLITATEELRKKLEGTAAN